MNNQLCDGSFLGGELEPGTFHYPNSKESRDDDDRGALEVIVGPRARTDTVEVEAA